jgi:hypothetical protein
MYLFFAGCLRHAAAPEGSAQADVRLLNSRGPELFLNFPQPSSTFKKYFGYAIIGGPPNFPFF